MFRVGFGYDVHPFEKGKKLYLGGIEINSDLGLKGHSDGDVLIHSIIDALLGACGYENIGELFPETEEYKNIDSKILLKKTMEKLSNIKIINIDTTVVTSYVKINKYKTEMKELLSKLMRISPSQVNIKGKSGNSLGIGGKNEGIEAYCVVLIECGE
ncbi:2-C-methyl-D-erythritol 2,4-cyclodiphosphate synthase [Marinitoga sp. 1135]|uniref:2-C-methyl-D-erythritol 2,4-cyclodiphosphate synthase n=1 Tax=unclassified Marinitoga TaxID=2640159 RepID=UPI000950A2C9|nr:MULTISPECIES: 2-C-methyl-D-erythritol 2,4-cyclodiphosphate synthase [unclassified Marinitoga]APT74967.1 2-C-methyl-D-erythritol 2,4-cyclodiphosphate synthase [Marinitoga sp. 1137]NUU94723.1 2-C-methyl-D-erythritol 2,4-cyclodiphosphate synthase [Marinitoga sp. 1135]NUU96652.1 2-C-methyl-D-erythritol 2,4-cyclodiphosphate synthase [Marinitoga sp. 1138]